MLTINQYLGLNITKYPEYGSYLAFEIYKQNNTNYVKVIFYLKLQWSSQIFFIRAVKIKFQKK